jgi:hypothetical protein
VPQTVTKDEAAGWVGVGVGLGVGPGLGVEVGPGVVIGEGDGVRAGPKVGGGPDNRMGSGVWMFFGTGRCAPCVGERARGAAVRPEVLLCAAAVSCWADSEVVAPHAAVAIRTTVAADRVLIIWAPIDGTHDPSAARLSRVETRGFAPPPHEGFALVVASPSIGSTSAETRLSSGLL